MNSENTALFLLSCFQYILTSIVLSVGPPFRQAMTSNGKRFWRTSEGILRSLTLVHSPLSRNHYHRPSGRGLHALPAIEVGVKGDAANLDV